MRTQIDIASDCKAIDAELDRGTGGTMSTAALEHLRACARCRELYRWMSEDVPAATPPASIQARVRQSIESSLAPVKPQAAPPVLAARFLIVFLLFASSAAAMMGPAGIREMNGPQLAGIGAVLVFGAGLISLSLAWQMSPGSLHRVPPLVAVVALASGFLVGIAILFPWDAPQAFLARGWSCLAGGLMMAAPAAALFWILVRRGYAMPSPALGATLGAISGLLGVSVLQLTCVRQEAGHLLVWHGGVLVFSIALGILVARAIETIGRSHK